MIESGTTTCSAVSERLRERSTPPVVYTLLVEGYVATELAQPEVSRPTSWTSQARIRFNFRLQGLGTAPVPVHGASQRDQPSLPSV